jgi:hypothetical protein
VIDTLLITLLVEGTVGLGYSLWKKKPIAAILLISTLVNLLTQSLLWIGLNLFFSDYLIALLIAEVFIWLAEGLLLYFLPATSLQFSEALLLSLSMNLASFALGWVLPV